MSNKKSYKRGAIARLVVWTVVLFILCGIFSVWMILDSVNIGSFSGGISFVSSYAYPNADKYNVGNKAYSEDIQRLDIDWVSGSVTLKIYSGSEIKIEESGASEKDADKMRTRIEKGILYVKYAASGKKLTNNKTQGKTLVVYLPLKYIDAALNEVEIETVSADVFINETEHIISCGELDVKSVSGEIKLDGISAREASIENVSGKVTVKGEYSELDVSTVSGKVSLAPDNKVPRISVDSVSGDVDLTIPDMGFKAELETVSGKMKFKSENVGRTHMYGDSMSKFDFETVSADVDIKIAN